MHSSLAALYEREIDVPAQTEPRYPGEGATTMPALGVLLQQLVALVLSLIGITQTRAEQQTLLSVQRAITDPAVGLAALHGQISSILADLATIEGDVLALGTPQQGGAPVTLPSPPPSGYGGISASDVWAEQIGWNNQMAGQLLDMAGQQAALIGYESIQQFQGSPYFGINYPPFGADPQLPGATVPYLDPSQHLSGNTLQDDANAQNPSLHFSPIEWPGGHLVALDPSIAFLQWITLLDDAAWQVLCAEVQGTRKLAPAWPGQANVTMGTPTPFTATAFTADGPMDGIVIDATTLPSPLPYYEFPGQNTYAKWGQIAFVNDAGQAEPWQWLTFPKGIYVPKTMVQAASCIVSPKSGTIGTITPWSIK